MPSMHGEQESSGKRGSAPSERQLGENLARVRDQLAAAARRAGRNPQDVRLVAVTKSVGVRIMNRLVRLGATDLGENRIQVAEPKIGRVEPRPCWHLIGHLQSNKARRAVTMFSWVHAVDSSSLLDRLERVARELRQRPKLLIQVNVSGEESKYGVTPAQLAPLLQQAARSRAVETVGLMTMAPHAADPEASRPHFRRLRELLEWATTQGPMGASFRHLSMGMSNDFEVAVEEGATLVRVGTALFQDIEPPMRMDPCRS